MPARHAFRMVRSEAPDLDNDVTLRVRVRSVNDSTALDDLVPTLLVYGTLPLLSFPSDRPSPSTFQRATALIKATAAMSNHFAKTQVLHSVRTRKRPNTTDMQSTQIDSYIFVYHREFDRWDRP